MVTEARRTVTQIEAAITTYALRYKDKHPKMIAAKASLADAKEKLRQAVLAQPAILRNAIEQTKATEASLQKHCKTNKGSQSPSIGQLSGGRSWRGKPKPIVRFTKVFFVK